MRTWIRSISTALVSIALAAPLYAQPGQEEDGRETPSGDEAPADTAGDDGDDGTGAGDGRSAGGDGEDGAADGDEGRSGGGDAAAGEADGGATIEVLDHAGPPSGDGEALEPQPLLRSGRQQPHGAEPPDPDAGAPGARRLDPATLPELFSAPTGRLLPAGLIYSRSGLDTGGGVSSALAVGLGDVAEFGLEVTDMVRARRDASREPGRIFPYASASFRMGVAEDRMFSGQPAMVLGFRKSFERDSGDHTTRFAELYLAASKRLGPNATIHAGGVFWDALLIPNDSPSDRVLLHELGWQKQLRAFGGLELRPLDDAQIMLELQWAPEFCYECVAGSEIGLRALFTWGVRYEVSEWMLLESGVRIPDIDDANLIDAQIFGQIKLINRRLRRAIRGPR